MHDRYVNPLCTRYAGRTMQHIYSDDNKFSTWRRLWVALAESEQELGLPITDAQLEQLRAHGFRVAVATGKPTPMARSILQRFDLERLFDCVIGCE